LTFAEVLRAQGYRTGVFGKWGLSAPGSEGAPNAQGFDEFFGYLCQREAHNFYPDHLWRNGERVELEGNTRGSSGASYSHDLIAEAALEFVRANSERPFLLYVPFTIPHLALQVPEDSLAEYRGLWDDPPYDGKKGYLPHPTPRAAYAAMVTRMDRDVGRLVALVDELGLRDDTLILFTSDNGPTYDRIGGSDSEFFASAAGLRGLKGSVYEGGLRVPLLARGFGVAARGGVSDEVGAFWDLFATLCEIGGAAPTGAVDGRSLASVLRGEFVGLAPTLYWELPSYAGGQQAVRHGDWKAVRRETKKSSAPLELYDLARDPGETRDLAAERPDVAAELARVMEREHTPHPRFALFPGEAAKRQ
jgi:arylsulfatase